MRKPAVADVAIVLALVLALAACGEPGVESGDASSLTDGATTTTAAPPDTTQAPPDTTVVETTTTVEETTTTIADTTTTAAAPTTTTEPELECIPPEEIAPMVAARSDGYDIVGGSGGLGAGDDRDVALMTSGGAVATQSSNDEDATVEYRIGPVDSPVQSGTIPHAVLYDLVVTPAGPAVLYGEVYQGDEEPIAYIQLLDIGTGTTTQITESQAPEYFVYRAMAADGIVVTSASADLTENISTWAIDGSGVIDRFSPVAEDKYGQPPFYGPAIPSQDGTRLAWLEGPDAVAGGSGEREGDWQLVVANATTGEEELRLFLGDTDDEFQWFDWDGRFAVLSRDKDEPVIGIDTDQPEYSPFDVCDPNGGLLTGIVTFVIDGGGSSPPQG